MSGKNVTIVAHCDVEHVFEPGVCIACERDTWKNRVASLCDRLDRIHLIALDRSLHANERLIRIRREAEGFARVPGEKA